MLFMRGAESERMILEGATPMEVTSREGLVSMVPDVSECALERPPRSSGGKPAARAER